MTISLRNLCLALIAIWMAVGAVAAVSFGLVGLAICMTIASSAFVLALGRRATGHFTSLTFIFLLFLALYGLSGPIAVVYGEGDLTGFPAPYLVGRYLVCFCLALIGVAIGMTIVPGIKRSEDQPEAVRWSGGELLMLSYFFALAASVMEITNAIRAGGFAVLLLGKAVAQSAVSELTGTLPATQTFAIATILFGLGLGLRRLTSTPRTDGRAVAVWLVLASPSIMTYLLLGQRGIILAGLTCFVVAFYWNRPLARITPSVLFLAVAFYISMGALYGARSQLGHGIASGDWSRLTDRFATPEYWVTSLNPASNEFGASFGNFNTFLLSRENDLLLGATYVKGLAAPIPQLVWPNKPKTATYEFRDRFFPELATRSRIAGTAFSSLLEAYMNFGVVGILPVYCGIVAILGWLERKRFGSLSSSLFFSVLYLCLIPVVVRFHRSAFANPLFWPLVMSGLTVIGYQILRSLKPRRSEA